MKRNKLLILEIIAATLAFICIPMFIYNKEWKTLMWAISTICWIIITENVRK